MELLAGKYATIAQAIRVLDCRFLEEFNGGHITGATHVASFDRLREIFEEDMLTDDRRITVFYCEFSRHRGPSMFDSLFPLFSSLVLFRKGT